MTQNASQLLFMSSCKLREEHWKKSRTNNVCLADSVFIPPLTALSEKIYSCKLLLCPWDVKCGQTSPEQHLRFGFTLAETRWRTATALSVSFLLVRCQKLQLNLSPILHPVTLLIPHSGICVAVRNLWRQKTVGCDLREIYKSAAWISQGHGFCTLSRMRTKRLPPSCFASNMPFYPALHLKQVLPPGALSLLKRQEAAGASLE